MGNPAPLVWEMPQKRQAYLLRAGGFRNRQCDDYTNARESTAEAGALPHTIIPTHSTPLTKRTFGSVLRLGPLQLF